MPQHHHPKAPWGDHPDKLLRPVAITPPKKDWRPWRGAVDALCVMYIIGCVVALPSAMGGTPSGALEWFLVVVFGFWAAVIYWYLSIPWCVCFVWLIIRLSNFASQSGSDRRLRAQAMRDRGL